MCEDFPHRTKSWLCMTWTYEFGKFWVYMSKTSLKMYQSSSLDNNMVYYGWICNLSNVLPWLKWTSNGKFHTFLKSTPPPNEDPIHMSIWPLMCGLIDTNFTSRIVQFTSIWLGLRKTMLYFAINLKIQALGINLPEMDCEHFECVRLNWVPTIVGMTPGNWLRWC